MTLEEALDEIIKLKETKKTLEEQVEQLTTNTTNLTNEKETLVSEVDRLKQKNYEYFEKLSLQFDKQKEVSEVEETEEYKPLTLDDIAKSL